ncbi:MULTISPECIES: TonB-dependent receptor [unclassified Saccharicrinis]|uniref:TonB-dependent receptor n=1 Tax=unclassified Saccharicrinis TaxID=2646859 RepID=UPI003D348118
MKKKWIVSAINYGMETKMWKIMRLSIFFLFLVLSNIWASSGYSQQTRLTLKMDNARVIDVLDEIEDNSEFYFLFNQKLVDVERKVDVDAKEKSINTILTEVFADTDVKHQVKDRLIILTTEKSDFGSEMFQQQQKTVSGSVVDSQGEPIPGVSVLVKGSLTGTITDIDGNFSLPNVTGETVLVFSFVGMTSQEIIVGSQRVFNVTMQDETMGLDEVVVVGYGTVKRKDFTGSVSSLKLENSAVANIANLNALESLKGTITGLNIGASNSAGDEPSMLIRGQNSISGTNDPLIVLDGVVYLGSLSDINPNDIASYDILKDAVSAAVYGSRSANGVIAITTKRGSSKKPVITLNTSTSLQTWQDRPVMMNGEQWIDAVNARNGFEEGTTSWMETGELQNYEDGSERVWLDDVTRVGVIEDYQLAISGAGEGLNYYLSSSYNNNKGVVVGDDFERISIVGKVNTDITSWLKFGVDGSYSRRDYSGFAASLSSAQTMSPYGVMYRNDQGDLEKYPYTQSGVNPLWGVNDGTRENVNITQSYRLNTFANIDIPWIKGLSYRINYITNQSENQSENFYYESYYVAEGEGEERYDPAVMVGYLSKANGNIARGTTTSYVFDNILNYKKSFGNHSIDVTAVATRDHKLYKYINTTGSDFSDNGNTSLGLGGLHKATVQKVNLNEIERSNIGYLGRFNYSFNDKYFVTSSYRRDGASVFGAEKKWGNFGAVGLAWKISNEGFMSNIEVLDQLKLKASWGQNGNQGIDPYTTLSQVKNGNSSGVRYEWGDEEGVINYGMYQSTLGNQELGWESTEAVNFGFESAWLNNRVFLDVDMYVSNTTDQIFNRSIPVMTGFKTIYDSMGKVNNKGIDVTLRTVNIKKSDLQWSTSLTFWKNKNKLVELYGEDNDGDGVEDDDISNGLFIGESLGVIYGYEQDGIVQEDDLEYIEATGAIAGNPKYKDLDGVDGITTDDRKILGYTGANFRLNMSNSVSYKNLEFYVMLAGTFGGNGYYMKSNTAAYLTGADRFNSNMTYKPYWTSENSSNVYPAATFTGDGRFKGLQSRGFVRVQDISLSYTFKQPWVTASKIKSLKVFLSAKNVATFTNWEGGDPETGATYTSNTFPVMSTYSVGANISF